MVSVYRFGEHLIPSGCVFLTTALSYAFTNRKPVLPGQKVPAKFTDLTPDEVSDLFLCVHKIAPVLQDMHSSSSLTIALQDGKDAGQTVEHVHVHIMPRQQGDFARNDDIYTELEERGFSNGAQSASQFRSAEEMGKEAAALAKRLQN